MIEIFKSRILDIVFNALLDARQQVLTVYRSSDMGMELKADKSPVTRADHLSHRAIMEGLANTPWPILSEEGRDIPLSERGNWKTYWLVDPLDGTKEFLRRNGEFTLNIALVDDHYPVAGWVYAPVPDTLYIGIQGMGAFKFEHASTMGGMEWDEQIWKAGVRLFHSPGSTNKLRVVVSRSHMDNKTHEFLVLLSGIFPDVEVIHGGSSLKFCMVAAGLADIYPRFGPTMEWDTAAGQAVAEAAGLEVLAWPEGEPVRYNSKENLRNPDFLVSRPGLKTMLPLQ